MRRINAYAYGRICIKSFRGGGRRGADFDVASDDWKKASRRKREPNSEFALTSVRVDVGPVKLAETSKALDPAVPPLISARLVPSEYTKNSISALRMHQK